MNIKSQIELNCYGTSEGVKKEWDERGRGASPKPKFKKGDLVRKKGQSSGTMTVAGNTKSTKGTWLVKTAGSGTAKMIPEADLEKVTSLFGNPK